MAGFDGRLSREWAQLTTGEFLKVWFVVGGLAGAEFARAADGVAPAADAFAAPYFGGQADRGALSDLLPPADGVADGGVHLWGRATGQSAAVRVAVE
jgi:hypothetical protein